VANLYPQFSSKEHGTLSVVTAPLIRGLKEQLSDTKELVSLPFASLGMAAIYNLCGSQNTTICPYNSVELILSVPLFAKVSRTNEGIITDRYLVAAINIY
jgi:hypothetical protein